MGARALLCLCLLWFTGLARAESSVAVGCLRDSSWMTLAQVRGLSETAWQRSDPRTPFAGLGKNDWCRVVARATAGEGLVLRLPVMSAGMTPRLTFYRPEVRDARAGVGVGGGARNFSNSRHPAVYVAEHDEGRPILFRISRPAKPALEVWDVSAFTEHERNEQSFHLAILCSMLVLGAMAVIFAFNLGRLVLVFLCVWVLAVVLRSLETGLLTQWLPLGELACRIVQSLSLTIAISASTIFSDLYLHLPRHFPRVSRTLRVLAAALWLVALLIVVRPDAWLVTLYNLLVLAQFVLAIACAVVLARRHDAMARFFMLGWSPVLAMSIVRTVYLLSSRPIPAGVEIVWQFTLLFAVFVLLVSTARAARYAEREMHLARKAAMADPLTGLANRSFLMATLDEGIRHARIAQLPYALLFLDIDHFKAVNDRHGHDAGDRCLRHFASVMQSRLRSSDVLARLGGEEFVVVLAGTPMEQARQLADALRNALRAAPINLEGVDCLLTMSVGVASLRAQDDAGSLLKRADMAVYRAKAEGRNRTVLEAAAEIA